MEATSTARVFDGAAVPARVVSGPGCRRAVARHLERIGAGRVLVVTGPTIRAATPLVAELEADLGDRLAGVWDRVRPHTPVSTLAEMAAHARRLGADAVLAVGGGSVHDAAKAIAVMAPSGRSIVDFVSRFEPPDGFHSPEVDMTPLAVATMPTTLSAADVVGGGAVTDTASGRKLIFVHPKLTPALVVLDGEAVATTPRKILAASGLNAVHHCLEALYSRGAMPITDALALGGLRGLVGALPSFAPDSPAPSVAVCQDAVDAAALSGLTYANSWLGIGHAVCHSLGGRYGLSHGEANSVMVRHSLRFNLEHARERLALAAQAAGAAFPAGQSALAARHVVALVDWLAERLRVPRTLRELGLAEGQFEAIADDVMADPQTYWNPRPVARADVIALLEAAW